MSRRGTGLYVRSLRLHGHHGVAMSHGMGAIFRDLVRDALRSAYRGRSLRHTNGKQQHRQQDLYAQW